MFENYGHINMRYIQEKGLYYFINDKGPWNITIATEFVPESATPHGTIPLVECDSGNIVGLFVDKTLYIFDITYSIPLEEMESEIW